MKFIGEAARLAVLEQAVILRIAADVGVSATWLAAIRLAEMGGKGREFGVLSEAADTYEAQARAAALSIRNTLLRFVGGEDAVRRAIDPATGFARQEVIAAMGTRWAPIGAANDPTHLNQNWVGNVARVYRHSGVVE